MEEIQFYVQECHLGATGLKRILRKKYPDQDIYSQDLYNAICRFKANAQIKNDAAILLEHLVNLHANDPEWYLRLILKVLIIGFLRSFGCHLIKNIYGHAFMMLS